MLSAVARNPHGGADRVSTKAKLADELLVLGRVLVAARDRAGVKQSEVAERLGLPPSYLSKVENGAWLPLVVGLAFAFLMVTWRQGREIVTRNRVAQEGPLDSFLERLRSADPPIRRFPGTAICLSPQK